MDQGGNTCLDRFPGRRNPGARRRGLPLGTGDGHRLSSDRRQRLRPAGCAAGERGRPQSSAGAYGGAARRGRLARPISGSRRAAPGRRLRPCGAARRGCLRCAGLRAPHARVGKDLEDRSSPRARSNGERHDDRLRTGLPPFDRAALQRRSGPPRRPRAARSGRRGCRSAGCRNHAGRASSFSGPRRRGGDARSGPPRVLRRLGLPPIDVGPDEGGRRDYEGPTEDRPRHAMSCGAPPRRRRGPQALPPKGVLSGERESVFAYLPEEVQRNMQRPDSESAMVWAAFYPFAHSGISFRDWSAIRPLWGSPIPAESDDRLIPYFWGLRVDATPLEGMAEAAHAIAGREDRLEVDLYLKGERVLVAIEAKTDADPAGCGRYAAGRCPEIHGGLEPHLCLLIPRRRWPALRTAWQDFAERVRDDGQWKRLRVVAWEDLQSLGRRQHSYGRVSTSPPTRAVKPRRAS